MCSGVLKRYFSKRRELISFWLLSLAINDIHNPLLSHTLMSLTVMTFAWYILTKKNRRCIDLNKNCFNILSFFALHRLTSSKILLDKLGSRIFNLDNSASPGAVGKRRPHLCAMRRECLSSDIFKLFHSHQRHCTLTIRNFSYFWSQLYFLLKLAIFLVTDSVSG